MFKYKIKVVGSEHKLYHIYRKKHWFGLWQDTNLVFSNMAHAERFVHDMNIMGKEHKWLSL